MVTPNIQCLPCILHHEVIIIFFWTSSRVRTTPQTVENVPFTLVLDTSLMACSALFIHTTQWLCLYFKGTQIHTHRENYILYHCDQCRCRYSLKYQLSYKYLEMLRHLCPMATFWRNLLFPLIMYIFLYPHSFLFRARATVGHANP